MILPKNTMICFKMATRYFVAKRKVQEPLCHRQLTYMLIRLHLKFRLRLWHLCVSLFLRTHFKQALFHIPDLQTQLNNQRGVMMATTNQFNLSQSLICCLFEASCGHFFPPIPSQTFFFFFFPIHKIMYMLLRKIQTSGMRWNLNFSELT